MGENEELPHLSGLLLNGLLPNETASVIRVLDRERWAEAEKRTAELIACIQPNQASEDRRGAVADYVQRLIMKCFPCQVVTFGSVPLKTYLPDGDIDVTAFSKDQNLKDTWAVQVRDILESEEKNEKAEFNVKEVQYIQAEVKIIKCLVENIVVDISFNQLSGLCTLCFLEEVDNLINQDHLFKRSIILIKAWCYYESRILGAHHGLISTYALETLVLYIFHIFNNSFTGPLEVLYRFLEFFRNFDWQNFSISLWGPVPSGSLPNINAEPPRKDGGELLLSKVFLQACNSVYAVFPAGLENQDPPFISKNFNVIDPLRINNNLGRSVSKGNFYRIRSAFSYGAKRLARLLDCPKESIAVELDHFFMNTWERHGSSNRPDAPVSELELRLSSPGHGSNNHLNSSNIKENGDGTSTQEIEVEADQSIQPLSSQRASHLENTSNCNDILTNLSSTSGMSDCAEKVSAKVSLQSDKRPRTLKHLFARTRSSPELTDAYRDSSSQSRRISPAESGQSHVASAKMDSSQRKSPGIETLSAQSTVTSISASNSHVDDSRNINISEDQAHATVIGAQGMQQEEQDLVNMMASSSLHNFGGHIPIPISQPFLASMGYGHRSLTGMFPGNPPFIDPHWGRNFQFYQGLMSNPVSHFPGVGLPTNVEDVIEHGDENLGASEVRRGTDTDYWHERDVALEVLHADDRQPSTSGRSKSSLKSHHKEHPTTIRDDHVEPVQHQDNRVIESHSSTSQAGSGKSRTSSESSWDGSSARVSKAPRDKRGRKAVASAVASSKTQSKGKNLPESTLPEVDEGSGENNITSSQPALLHIGQRPEPSESTGAGRFTFYPTGPPVPFFTMLPVHNYPSEAEADGSEPSSNHLVGDDGPDDSDSGQNFESTTGELSEEPKRDILDSDFASHWQNLHFGRLCQGPRYPAPVVSPPPVAVPPVYLQGRVPWDGPGRPLSANANLLSQLMGYGHHLVPVIPLQSDSSRPAAVYQQYAGELPRYRNGTGTYLPNPKASVRDRQSSGGRRNSYNYDRTDHADREGNWNAAKSRAAGRSHNRRQAEKSRADRFTTNENRADRPWGTHRHQQLPYQSQNGQLRVNSTHGSSTNVAYGVYPTSNGPAMQSYVMLYPYDHNSGFLSPADQPEFGSFGAVGYVGPSDAAQPSYEDQRYHRSSVQLSSPEQPSSPHFHRRT